MPNYRVIAHRRVLRFLKSINNENQKNAILKTIENLDRYPISLREMDVAAVRGVEKSFRIRIGRYRIIFTVEKDENTIYVTHLDTRKKIYKKP